MTLSTDVIVKERVITFSDFELYTVDYVNAASPIWRQRILLRSPHYIRDIAPAKTRCPYDRGKLSSLSMPRAVSYRRHGAQILRLPCRSITITLLFRTHTRGNSLGLYIAHFRSAIYPQLLLRLNLFDRRVSRYQL